MLLAVATLVTPADPRPPTPPNPPSLSLQLSPAHSPSSLPPSVCSLLARTHLFLYTLHKFRSLHCLGSSTVAAAAAAANPCTPLTRSVSPCTPHCARFSAACLRFLCHFRLRLPYQKMCVYIHLYTHTPIHIHTHTYTYTHLYTDRQRHKRAHCTNTRKVFGIIYLAPAQLQYPPTHTHKDSPLSLSLSMLEQHFLFFWLTWFLGEELYENFCTARGFFFIFFFLFLVFLFVFFLSLSLNIL